MNNKALSKESDFTNDIDDRVAKLSDAKRALLELRLARNGVKTRPHDHLASTSPSSSSLAAIQPGGSKPPFFWIHGENSTFYLPRFLGPEQPLYGIFHQSRDGRRARYTLVEDIAAHYLEEIRSVQPEGPYFLGGFCFGGTIVFEMARYLRKQGQEVGPVILVDPATPGLIRRQEPGSNPTLPLSTPNDSSLGNRLAHFLHKFAQLRPQAKPTYVFNRVTEKSSEGLPTVAPVGATVASKAMDAAIRIPNKIGAVSIKFASKLAGRIYYQTGIEPIPTSLVNSYLDVVYRRAARAYKPQLYPGRVIILSTEDNIFDPRTGFADLVGGGLEVIELDCKHTEIVFTTPGIEEFGKKLKVCLDSAQISGACKSNEAGAVT